MAASPGVDCYRGGQGVDGGAARSLRNRRYHLHVVSLDLGRSWRAPVSNLCLILGRNPANDFPPIG